MKHILYINLYRSGYYHRQGKPLTTNLHAGDVYDNERTAKENAEPDRGYITTVPFEVDLPGPVYVNGEGSIATPLSVTRQSWNDSYPERVILPYVRKDDTPPMEMGDDYIGPTYEQWRANREASGFQPAPAAAYKLAHRGYPENGGKAASWDLDRIHTFRDGLKVLEHSR